MGVLTLENPQPNAYTAPIQAFVAQLAIQAAVALANALLYFEWSQAGNAFLQSSIPPAKAFL